MESAEESTESGNERSASYIVSVQIGARRSNRGHQAVAGVATTASVKLRSLSASSLRFVMFQQARGEFPPVVVTHSGWSCWQVHVLQDRPNRYWEKLARLPHIDYQIPWETRTETRCPPRFVCLRRIRDRGTRVGKGVRRLPRFLARGVGAVNGNNVATDLTR